MRIAEGGFPWPSTVALLYPLGAAIHIATATPAGLADVVGYGLGNLSYLLFAAGICGGSFRILGLNTRGRVFGAAVVSFLMGTLLSNIGKVTGLEVAGLVAVLLIVAAGSYGVLQSYRRDLDRPSRVLSLLLAIPALVVIAHVFPVIGIPVLWSIATATWCLLLYIGRARDIDRTRGGTIGVLTSLVSAWKLWRISKDLALPTDMNVLLSEDDRREEVRRMAEEKLLDLCESLPAIQPVLRHYGANRETLREALQMLLAGGAGQWVKGYYVAAGAFAYGVTVDFVLRRLQEPPSLDRNIDVAFRLIKYFENGETGSIP